MYKINFNELKIDKPKDKFFKILFRSMADVFIKTFGINERIKEFYPTELITDDFKSLMMDLVFTTYNGEMVVLEFHSGNTGSKNLRKFFQYGANLSMEVNKPTNIYVIATGKREKSIKKIKTTNGLIFEPKIIFFKDMDGDKELKELEEKIKKNEDIDFKTLSNLVFIPFMESEKTHEYMVERVCNLTNEVKNISENEKILIKNCQIILLNIFVKDLEKFSEILRVIKMKNDFFEEFLKNEREEGIVLGREEGRLEGIVEGKEEGRLEGIMEGKKEALDEVKSLINKGHNTKEIKNILQL